MTYYIYIYLYIYVLYIYIRTIYIYAKYNSDVISMEVPAQFLLDHLCHLHRMEWPCTFQVGKAVGDRVSVQELTHLDAKK